MGQGLGSFLQWLRNHKTIFRKVTVDRHCSPFLDFSDLIHFLGDFGEGKFDVSDISIV